MHHFAIDILPSSNLTTSNIPITITGYDINGNTVTSVGGGSVIEVLAGGAPVTTPGTIAFSPAFEDAQFTGDGTYTGTLNIRKAGMNYSLRVTNPATPDALSNTFNILPGTATRYVFILPGQTYTPGVNYGTGYGKTGNPNSFTAGTAANVSIVAADTYGNQIAGAFSNVTISMVQSDNGARINSSAPPVLVSLANGSANLSSLFTVAYSGTQQVRASGGGISGTHSSSLFSVAAATLDHFSIGNIAPAQTAGTPFNTIIAARDVYENVVTSFTGPVYVTCPNLDYHSSEQSVINVGGGSAAGVTWTVSSGFTNGQWSNNITVYRAGTGVTLFVATSPNGTGKTGTSSPFTVNPAGFTKTFIIVPGLAYRPGVGGGVGNMTGGYTGTPDAQQAGTPFHVTVYAADAWWNRIPGISSSFRMTSQPTTSTFDGSSWTPPTGVAFNFTDGQKLISTKFTNADVYKLTADSDTPGVEDYTMITGINVITIDHFKITDSGGGSLATHLIAGQSFNIRITAYQDALETTIATTFNSQANLTTNADYEEPFRVISPQRVTFTNGVWSGAVTIYRAKILCNINCQIGLVSSMCLGQPNVFPNAASQILALAPGMTAKPGIAPDTYPPGGFPGYMGNPTAQEAGVAFNMVFQVCDDYYNVVTGSAHAAHTLDITSSDPYPATINSLNLPQNGTLTMTLGQYATSDFKLYTVGANGYQSITAADHNDGAVTPFTLGAGGTPSIPLKHTYLARPGGAGNAAAFRVDISGTDKLAGVAFSCTITAQDEFGNVMDNRNGATSFSPSGNVNLSSGSGTHTLYPTIIQLPDNGMSSHLMLTCYKQYEGMGNSVTASFTDINGNHDGTSVAFDVIPNAFARLIPIVPGMNISGGVYMAEPPTQFLGYSGLPSAQTAGNAVTLRVYACDTYGNVTAGAQDVVRITSTDRFAPNPQLAALTANGFVDFNGSNLFAFHRAAPAVITAADITHTSVTSGSTPLMTVNPATAYGLVTLAPGQVLCEGSGNSNMAGGIAGVPVGGWYSGVTMTDPGPVPENAFKANAEIIGAPFSVTIAATDVFGNRLNFSGGFQVRSNDPDPASVPNVSAPYTGTFAANGSAVMTSTLFMQNSPGMATLYPWDTNPSNLNHNQESRSDIQMVSFGQTHFSLLVNGVGQPGPVTISAAPSTFQLTVQVRDDISQQIVRTANTNFILEAFTDINLLTPGTGDLNVTFGQTLSGELLIPHQTYSKAETIYIRVREAAGAERPTSGFSAELRVIDETPSTLTPTPSPQLTTTPPPTATTTATSIPTFHLTTTSTPTATTTATPTLTPPPLPTVTPTATPGIAVAPDDIKLVNNRFLPYASPQPVSIHINLSESGEVTATLYTSQGRLARKLADRVFYPAGRHTLTWDGKYPSGQYAPSGIYVLHIQASKINKTARIAVIK